MPEQVMRQDEVLLYGTRFPINGQIRRTAVTPFAPKFVIGDYTRDDQIIASSWILSSFGGGLGVQEAQLPRDADRYRYGTLEARYRHLVLGSKVYRAGTLTGAADLAIEYNEQFYIVIGPSVWLWSESLGDWTLIKTMTGGGTGYEIYNGLLYILTQSGLHRYDSSTDTWDDYVSGYIPSGYAMIEWDGKLFRLGLDNTIYWTINPDQDNNGISVYDPLTPGANTNDWEAAGQLHIPSGYCRQLIIYFDLTGEPVIHAVTRAGVYGYDFASKKFYETPLTYPVTQNIGQAMVYRGELYVPAGKTGYKYNGSTIQIVSPSKDDGLPEQLQGDIIAFVPGHAFYYALISSYLAGTTEPVDIEFFDASNPLDPYIMSEATSYGSILASPGMAWHSVFNEPVGGGLGAALVASIEGTFRLWITSDEGIYYIPLDTGLHNPLQNPAATFRSEGYLETGWTDLGWSEIRKLALEVNVVAEASLTEPIRIYAGWDDNEAWELVATVIASGHQQFSIGDLEGLTFRTVRFRIEMESTADERKTPVLKQMVFAFMRRPPMLWGWEVQIVMTKDLHGGLTHEELLHKLVTIAEYEKRAGAFIYRDPVGGGIKEHRVVIANIQGAETPGDDAKARYTISLIQLDTPTTEEEDEFIETA